MYFPSVHKQAVRDLLVKLDEVIQAQPLSGLDLAKGKLGRLLYHFYYYKEFHEVRAARQGAQLLTEILDLVEEGKSPGVMNSSLFGGLAGVGLTLEILQAEGLIEGDFTGLLGELDEYVYIGSARKLQMGNTGYLYGGTGGLHYLSFRTKKNPAVNGYLASLVNELSKTVVAASDRVFIPNTYLADQLEENQFATGLAQGMAGVLLVLLNVYALGIAKEQTERLIHTYVETVLRKDCLSVSHSPYYFPSLLSLHPAGEMQPVAPCKPASWAEGDLNQLHLLYRAAAGFKQDAWQAMADKATPLVLDQLDRTADDISLLHGVAGVAHYVGYLAGISTQEGYSRAYEWWLRRCMAVGERAISTPSVGCRHHFLEGYEGLALVLLAYLDEERPYWEKNLLF